MSDDAWGFADIYSMDDDRKQESESLQDVQGDDWRNILVLGRAAPEGLYGETLALVGRARYMADELGCRVEVLLIGDDLDRATEILGNYPINTVYRVQASDYAPIDETARIVEAVVKKRRPELVMGFQSRTGDAVIAYAANRLGVGFVIGALDVSIDTNERRVRATHVATNTKFQITTEFQDQPQFVTVQRGLFRAPMEDPYASVQVHDLPIDPGRRAAIEVVERRPPAAATLATAQRVVIAGAMADAACIDAARRLAKKLDARFGVTRSVHDRDLASDDELVGSHDTNIAPRLLITVGVRGSLDFLMAIQGEPTLCALGSEPTDPIAKRAAYVVPGKPMDAVRGVLEAL